MDLVRSRKHEPKRAEMVDFSSKHFGAPPNKRLKLAARVDYRMYLSSARRSLSAIR